MSGSAIEIPSPSAPSPQFEVATLYKLHRPWLLSWLKKKVGCPEEAADLSQDTFVSLLTSLNAKKLIQPRAYILVVASRLMINRFNRRKVEQEVLSQVSILIEKQDNRCPSDIVASRELLSQVMFLLTNELDDKPRIAFYMARIEGATYQEIAKHLGVSESSVKQYLAKVMMHCHARFYDNKYH